MAEHASEDQWTAVDDYLTGLLAPGDEALTAALADSEAAGLPHIAVAPNQGKFLHLIAQIQGARRVLEIGTLGGYSTIWLARALPADGLLVTLEYNPRHAEVARGSPALDSLPGVAADHPDPFDLVFIDADKANNPHYVEWALRLTRPGSVIIVDNVVRGGRVTDDSGADSDIRGTRAALQMIADHPKLDGTAVQTVGVKGYDGFALARVLP
jgi:predicted O-methyltransferase YrrM